MSGYKIVNQKSIHFEVASLGLKYSFLSLLSAKSVKSENYTTVTSTKKITVTLCRLTLQVTEFSDCNGDVLVRCYECLSMVVEYATYN